MNWQTPSSTTVSWSKRKILSKRHLFGVVATEQRVRITWQQTLHSVLFSAQHSIYIHFHKQHKQNNQKVETTKHPSRCAPPICSLDPFLNTVHNNKQ